MGIPLDADALAAQQGIRPVEDFHKFLKEIGDAWPDGEDVDEFIADIRTQRRENAPASVL